MKRPSPALFVIGALVVVATQLSTTAAFASPPDPPALGTIAGELAAIPTRVETGSAGYSRDLFPHWATQSGSCDTRETVLARDGENVVTSSTCSAISGSWYSVYEGAWNYASSDVDIDHVVALSEAWGSGASTWTTTKRGQFANSLGDGQLIAVTDNVNASKSDRDAAEWQPPLASYHCTYAKQVVHVKYGWGLSMDSAEKAAINAMLATC
ncbi:HNH endonuclease family protein [Cryobacterium fucosi]|uniref:HNH endonuclease n=1 Tax=Cryobacterium fucosi TaxID=1259157 RepID=A0A4R9AZA4_9MICO|nr:HNH endonuclease family protein [Cryobacterium fucosi]TFD73315.1 HNH endonuclease [Cryobacterium fucosi]